MPDPVGPAPSIRPRPPVSLPPGDSTRDDIRRIVEDIDQFVQSVAPPRAAAPPDNVQDDIRRIVEDVNNFVEETTRQNRGAGTTGANPGQTNVTRFGQALGCQFRQEADGTLRRVVPGGTDTCVYTAQPDGTLRRSAGVFTPAGGAAVNLPERTLYFDGNTLREADQAISPYTRPLQRINARQNANGTFNITGAGNTVNISLIPNPPAAVPGAARPLLYHNGGTLNGIVVGPQIYEVTNPDTGEGAWRNVAPADSNLVTGSNSARMLGLVPHRDGTNWVAIPQEGQESFGTSTVAANGQVTWSGGVETSSGLHYPPLVRRYNAGTSQMDSFVTIPGDPERPLQVAAPRGANPGYYYVITTPAAAGNPARIRVFNHRTGAWGAEIAQPPS